MTLFKDKDFENTVVNLDDNTFKNCKIKNCQIVYGGGPLPSLIDCSFIDSTFMFDGAASRTLAFMQILTKSGAENVVKQIFDSIFAAQTDQKP